MFTHTPPDTKKRKSKDFLFWVPSGILSLRSSDFVDDEPTGSCTTVHKKETDESVSLLGAQWDSNPRHSEPQSDALTN